MLLSAQRVQDSAAALAPSILTPLYCTHNHQPAAAVAALVTNSHPKKMVEKQVIIACGNADFSVRVTLTVGMLNNEMDTLAHFNISM